MTTPGRRLLIVWTQSSVYEVDEKVKLIRRTGGVNPPTERTGLGWKPFHSFHAEAGAPAEILWRITEAGTLQMTITSNVVAVEIAESIMSGRQEESASCN